MAASKPEIIMILDIVQQYSGAKGICKLTENRKSKMAAIEPKVFISQLLDGIAKTF